MIDFPYLADLIRKRDNKILMLVLSGVGGPPNPMYGRSELDAARVPNLDHLSRQSVGGLALPVGPGISPGGTPGNLALLGYDPLKYIVARGPLEAIGTGLRLEPGDIAARVQLLRDSGVENLIFFVNFGGIEHRKVLDSLELFAREVMPLFPD